jgi:hypothetical protein
LTAPNLPEEKRLTSGSLLTPPNFFDFPMPPPPPPLFPEPLEGNHLNEDDLAHQLGPQFGTRAPDVYFSYDLLVSTTTSTTPSPLPVKEQHPRPLRTAQFSPEESIRKGSFVIFSLE